MCKASERQLQGTVVKESPNASNYRAELLGALCCLLLIKAATESGSGQGKCAGYCDNNGVVIHCAGLTKQSKIKIKQSQDNLVRLCKELSRGMSIGVSYHHVKGHMGDILRIEQLSLEESLNVKADELMDEALKRAVRENTSMNPDLPYEQIKVTDKETGQKAARSIADNLSRW